uniref:Uncharacterized protein n=1 Tax=Equus asinus TaxID=9793 RepID=A0A9L0JIH7_EQUAS
SVADKIGLLISPHFLCSYNKDHNSENEKDSEPDFPNTGGVFIDTPQNSLQCAPIHLLLWAVCTGKDKMNTGQRREIAGKSQGIVSTDPSFPCTRTRRGSTDAISEDP